MTKKPGQWTEAEVVEETLKVLESLYKSGVEVKSRGPDIRVQRDSNVIFLVDCKRSQPLSKAGNHVPDRALGQMMRYFRKHAVPVFLVVPDDWELKRKQGETGEPWKSQVERLLISVSLDSAIRVVTVGEIKSAGFKFELSS